ncbi:MAG TPA: hypothetical protein VKB50_21745 [Vicinamibacterales bacterium]|nr:hypothetical protein [Vicinamibacterales bacterium]
MTLDALIQAASESPLRAKHVEAAAENLRATAGELYDLFARTVAQRYLSGELSYTSGDAAMTHLFGYATSGGGPELSRLAWQVFEAFDEGEYVHVGEPAEQQGEVKTRALLARITELRDA